MTPRFLITNAVPLNGGDEALLRAVVESLERRHPGAEITVLCRDVEKCREQLPDLKLAPDLEFARDAEERRAIVELYRQADAVLSAPGGFIHDFYEIEGRLVGFEVAMALRKPVVLLPQSLGPFWKPASRVRVAEVLGRVHAICVRDEASVEHLRGCGLDGANIRMTADAAFLWRQLAPELLRPGRSATRRVGLCFREWPVGNEAGVAETIAKADQLCRHLLADEDRELLFVSTCQGIPGYVDDSALAVQVVEGLPGSLRDRCTVDRRRHGPRSLMGVLSTCDAFIGMRLHGCILAMLAGTPAMGLGYEQKTAEIFRQLGFVSYQLPFESEAEAWIRHAERFLADAPRLSESLPAKLDEMAERATEALRVAAAAASAAMPGAATAGGEDRLLDDLLARFERQLPSDVPTAELLAVIPAGERLLWVDGNAWGAEPLRGHGREVRPFTEREGMYWGPPADDRAAIEELERARRAGVGFIAFAWPAYWWLDHYAGLRRHLDATARVVVANERVTVFALGHRAVRGSDGEGSDAVAVDERGSTGAAQRPSQ